MNSLKSTLTPKISTDRIETPRSHKERLVERKETKLKCIECEQEFKVKDNNFKSNNFIKKQLDEHVYLNDAEISLKKQIKDPFEKLFQMYKEFALNKSNRDLDVHEHFQEIRFKLDEHREELKVKIDDFYMEMIDKTKKIEATYLKSFEDQLEASLRSFETKSLEQSLTETEDIFRNPNVLIDSIQNMPQKQEEAI
jgi:hypothetical protein